MKPGNGTEKKTVVVLLLFPLIIASASLATKDYSTSELIEQSQTCLDCHEDFDLTLKDTPHQLSRTGDLSSPVAVGCISCHDGWAVHLDDPSAENIESVADLSPADQQAVCSRCHLTAHQAGMATSDPHARLDLTCTSCHQAHVAKSGENETGSLVKECRDCHFAVAAEFNRRSAHPLNSGNIRCVDCHNLSGLNDEMFNTGLDWGCQNCHGETSGPFVFEHRVTYGHLVDGGGCTECHHPHGSPNDRLLKQPRQGLCLQCHGMPPGHARAHSGFVANTDCVVCHSQIHGSNDNRLLLDPELNLLYTGNCYQSGCHSQP
jgi:DmsE family decaheme c-type cytochrome